MIKTVKEIKKREGVVIRICKGEFGGYEYGEIRQYIRDKNGLFNPSKKGLTFSSDLLDELIEGLMELKKMSTNES